MSEKQYSFWKIAGPVLYQFYAGTFFSKSRYTYTGFMVQELLPTILPSQVGYYAGILIGCYYIAQGLNGILLGYFCNRFGVFKILYLNAISGIFFPLLYGLVTDFWFACFLSILYGFVNSVTPTVKVYMHQKFSPVDSQYGLSYLNGFAGLCVMTAPIAAGYLSYPAQKHPSLDFALLRSYPFLLPNICCSLLSIVALILLIKLHYADLKASKATASVNDTDAIHPPDSQIMSESNTPVAVMPHTPVIESNDVYSNDEENCLEPQKSSENEDSSFLIYLMCRNNTQVKLILTVYSVMCSCYVVLDTLFPLLLMLPREDGGFGQNTNGVATWQILQGVVSCTFNPMTHIVLNYLGPRWAMIGPLLGSIPLMILLPWTVHLSDFYGLLASFLLVSLSRNVGSQVAFTPSMNLINCCCKKRFLGHVNGIAFSLASLGRFVGPIICSALFAWTASTHMSFPLNQHFAFYIYSLMVVSLVFLILRLRGLNSTAQRK